MSRYTAAAAAAAAAAAVMHQVNVYRLRMNADDRSITARRSKIPDS